MLRTAAATSDKQHYKLSLLMLKLVLFLESSCLFFFNVVSLLMWFEYALFSDILIYCILEDELSFGAFVS